MSGLDKGVIYTAIFGSYDRLHEPSSNIKSYDLVCFTDDKTLKSDVWDVRYVESVFSDPVLDNRYYKMNPHELFPNRSRSIYLDGNIKINKDPSTYFDGLSDDILMAIPPHPFRSCVYDEVDTCLKSKHIGTEEADYWREIYMEKGFPRNQGLYENNIIFRRHNDPAVIKLMHIWWDSFVNYAKRDQLSLSLLAWQEHITIAPVKIGPRYTRKYFRLCVHEKYRNKGLLPWLIRHLKNNRRIGLLAIWIKQFSGKK